MSNPRQAPRPTPWHRNPGSNLIYDANGVAVCSAYFEVVWEWILEMANGGQDD